MITKQEREQYDIYLQILTLHFKLLNMGYENTAEEVKIVAHTFSKSHGIQIIEKKILAN